MLSAQDLLKGGGGGGGGGGVFFFQNFFIQIWGVELSSPITYKSCKKIIQKSYQKNLSKITRLILPYFTDNMKLLKIEVT